MEKKKRTPGLICCGKLMSRLSTCRPLSDEAANRLVYICHSIAELVQHPRVALALLARLSSVPFRLITVTPSTAACVRMCFHVLVLCSHFFFCVAPFKASFSQTHSDVVMKQHFQIHINLNNGNCLGEKINAHNVALHLWNL